MRISDWSSDVCSSDLDELREVVKKARSGSSEALAKAELKLSRTFARYVSDVRRKPSIKITYLDRELEPERLTEAAILRAAALVPSFADYMDDARSEEHTSELQSLMRISYAVFCLQKKKLIHYSTSQQ